MKMNLGLKIGIGFGSLLGVTTILGIMVVFSMSGVKSVLTKVLEVNVPMVEIANSIERHSIHMIEDFVTFGLNEDKNYYESGMAGIEKIKDILENAKNHAQKHSISSLQKSESEIRKLLIEYEALAKHSLENVQKLEKERANMELIAKNLMENHFNFLDDQNTALSKEIEKGASKSIFRERHLKITEFNKIIDLINSSRINNFKFQANNKKEDLDKALEGLTKIENMVKQIFKVTKKEEHIIELNSIQKASTMYGDSIKAYVNNLTKIKEENNLRKTLGDKIVALAQDFSNQVEKENATMSDRSIETLSVAMTTIIIGIIVALIAGAIIATVITRSIALPAVNMAAAAKAIALGDITQEVTFVSDDELGQLADSFRGMIGYFTDASQIAHAIEQGDLNIEIKKRSDKDVLFEAFTGMVVSLKESARIAHSIGEGNLDVEIKKRSERDVLSSALENMVANLKKIMSELMESTSVLNSAAGEILATTSQIASSAAQTSSSVAETTSSVEEIKQSAKLTNEKAVHTAESTKKAVIISDEGNSSLEKNMQGLAQIKEKMDSIAANIIRLSEQSQMIGNIVSTVEDIASQSNLLAVNASIEAVKAGEQGKGFSVVAQELKNLANQSKQGTAEVQKILSDIQQATNTLVMVAEQGGKAVDEGVLQATNAKNSMQSLRQSVIEAAQSGTLIAASSEQEMAGMDQIASAMMGIRDATSQNVESIRQVESSAKDLNNLSQKLKVLMDQYSFGGKIS